MPGCNAALANNQEDVLNKPTFINTVRKEKIKANTKDHLAGLSTENKRPNFHIKEDCLETVSTTGFTLIG